MLAKQFITLIWKEAQLEYRRKYAFSTILLYILSTVFIVYSATKTSSTQLWIALFWIVLMFSATNATSRSFYQESGHRQLFYYQLCDPLVIIFSKWFYNTILIVLVGLMNWIAFSFFWSGVVKDKLLFVFTLFICSTALSAVFTFISSIAGKVPNTAAMTAILAFPLLIPVLLIGLKLTAQSCNLINDTSLKTDIGTLLSIDGLLIGAMIFLFPFVWRD